MFVNIVLDTNYHYLCSFKLGRMNVRNFAYIVRGNRTSLILVRNRSEKEGTNRVSRISKKRGVPITPWAQKKP